MENNKLYIIDTSVLIHDPEALRNFDGADVALPIFVIMELDDLKASPRTEVASAARTASRRISALMELGSLHEGSGVINPVTGGRVSVVGGKEFGLESLRTASGNRKMDLLILEAATAASKRFAGKTVTLVTKDVNLRILADSLGLRAEDYKSDRVRPNDVPVGYRTVHVSSLEELAPLYERRGEDASAPLPFGLEGLNANEFVAFKEPTGGSQLFRYRGNSLRPVQGHWKGMAIKPRNLEQRMALELLMDPNVTLVTLLGAAGTGKAQPLDAKVLTPDGWRLMGEIKPGNSVIARDGSATPVEAVFPQGEKDIFRVHFTDGTSAECCPEHLWYTETALDRDAHRAGSVKSLEEIMGSLRARGGKRNHSIPITGAIQFPERELPLDPYLLGCLLGDGSLAHGVGLTSKDKPLIEECSRLLKPLGCALVKTKHRPCDYNVSSYLKDPKAEGSERRDPFTGERVAGGPNPVKAILSVLGLAGVKSEGKFIPDAYKFSSEAQRLALLQGLMDTDGTVGKGGDKTYSTVSPRLCEDVRFLVESLGGTATVTTGRGWYTYKGERKQGQLSYCLHICLPNGVVPFRLARKAERVRPATKYHPRRYVDRVEYVGRKAAQCIRVAHPDHLYLTDHCIVTHNTLCALAAAVLQLDTHYDRIILSKAVVPMGRDLGYLPGSEAEKMHPWVLSYYDNLDQLFPQDNDVKGRKGSTEKNYEQLIHSGRIQIQPLHSVRGRSIARSLFIVDEVQNLSPHEIRTVVSRAATGTKMVLCGDPSQIDDAYLDAQTNGLVHVAEAAAGSAIAGTVTLQESVRSPLAELAATLL